MLPSSPEKQRYSLRSNIHRSFNEDQGKSKNEDKIDFLEGRRKDYQLRPRITRKNYEVRIPLFDASPKKSEDHRKRSVQTSRRLGGRSFAFFRGYNRFENLAVAVNSSDDEFDEQDDRKRIFMLHGSANKSLDGFKQSSSGKTLTDSDPLAVDKSIDFNSIGGLSEHVKSLKEMIVLPLLYPEIFSKFNINPPVLYFY